MSKADAAVFILLGQSNAVGFATSMTEQDRIISPLNNVYGLSRTYNLSYDSKELVWTGYTSCDTILGEENDHTYSVTNCLAHSWQNAIDAGSDLPDLYLINISIGAQGVTSEYMWYPDRKPVLIPGPLGVVNISLCPFAAHIFSLLRSSFEAMGKTFEIIGLHWRGGENDFCIEDTKLEPFLKGIYQKLFHIFYDSLGEIPPVVLHRLVCADRAMDNDSSGVSLKNMHFINGVFDELASENGNIAVFDVREAPYFIPDVRGNGLFIEDVVHFTPEVNQWVAQQIQDKYVLEHLSTHLNDR